MPPPEPPRTHVPSAAGLEGAWFQRLADSLRTGVVLLDSEGSPVFANEAARDLLLGAGGTDGSKGPRDDREDHLALLRDVLPEGLRRPCAEGPQESEGSDRCEVVVESAAGERRLLLRSVRIEGEDCGAMVLVEDKARTAALEASLAMASRLRLQSVFRSRVHDLKAPLNALALNLELLRRTLDEREAQPDARDSQHDLVELLRREIARLGRALDAALSEMTPRPAARSPRRLDVRRLIREAAAVIRPSAQAVGVVLRTRIPKSPAYAVADREALKEALLNLALNAIEAQPDGGGLRFVVRHEEGWVRVHVEDDGPGIPEELLERVFEMNFTTKREGTGIGLTMARSLVEDQGGRLHLECPPHGGTVVHIHLPESRS